MSELNSSLMQKTIVFSVEKHLGQYRDASRLMPYVTHPIDVMLKLRYVGGITNENILCAALLHDILEETDTEEEELYQQFGPEVTQLVVELTRGDVRITYPEELTRQQIREMQLESLLTEIREKMSDEARVIKLADRASNLEEALYSRRGEKLLRYLEQTQQILNIIPKRINPPLWKYLRKKFKKAHKQVSDMNQD
jgi:guanosine-3',5'-bis(diphosphate) 3'-pyrophosphohydrolase